MLFTPIKPMIVSSGIEAFDDDRYMFEPKWDGARILLHKQGDRIEAYTRNGLNVTNKFPELKEAAAAIKAHTAILDCEGIVMRGGRPVFDDFAYRLRLGVSMRIRSAVHSHPATFVAFDLLCTDREHLHEPLMIRKERLREVIAATPALTPTLYLEKQGKALFETTKQGNMEGIVAKKKDSKYFLNTASQDWIKIKHPKTIDVIILGYNKLDPFRLIIGLNFRTVKNKPVGTVELKMSTEEKLKFAELVQPYRTGEDRQTCWLQPRLCCRIEYLDRTDTHQLGSTVFKEWLLDKNPEDCIWSS